jgi:hypothetical protein
MRAENTIYFVKNTMFKNKIHTKSEIEIKLYFKNWLNDMNEKGYMSPNKFKAIRAKRYEAYIKAH